MKDVVLLQDIPEEERASMERYAHQIERGFQTSATFQISMQVVPEGRIH